MQKEEKITFSYPYSRRQFLKGIAVAGALTIVPWQISCHTDTARQEGTLGKYSQLAADLLGILFPTDGNGPGSRQLHSYEYLNWILQDINYDADIQKSIRNGFSHFDAFAKEQFGKPFTQLSLKNKEKLVANATEYRWGKNFLSRLVSVILDSLVIDPIYHTNTNEAGWKWLEHIPGNPRANTKSQYPKILDRKNELVIITSVEQL